MEFPLVRDGVGVAAWEAGPMPSMDGMQHVNVYRRRRGRGGGRKRTPRRSYAGPCDTCATAVTEELHLRAHASADPA